MIKINFSYTDEFEQESTLIKTYTESVLIDQDTFTVLVEEFKTFMLASGFSKNYVDRIVVKEDISE